LNASAVSRARSDRPAERRRSLDPAGEFAPDHRLDDRHALVAVVQAGDMRELFAAGIDEFLAYLAIDLVERLDAVGGKTRVHHGDPPDPVMRQLLDRLVGIGLEPF